MQQAQMTTLYKTRYPVKIMGRDYATGEVVDDPTIDGKVLRRMADNNRLVLVPMVQRLVPVQAGEFDDGPDEDEPDLDDEPLTDDEPEGEPQPEPESAPESAPESDETASAGEAPTQAPIAALTAPVAAPVAATAPTEGTNRAWKADFAKSRKEGETIKGYLQRVLMSNQLPITGTVPDMVKRLTSAGVQPGVAGH
jgi:hypothetical protein